MLFLGGLICDVCTARNAANIADVGDAVADVARGPVDSYQAGFERSRFLAAAGVDTELDAEEFKANPKANKPWVRVFDSWTKLRAFDRNGNGTIDWFEADAYRKAVRTAVLGQFDKDKNNRLNQQERDEANKLLASGRTPKLTAPKARTAQSNLPESNLPQAILPKANLPARSETQKRGIVVNQRNTWDKNGDGKFSDEERKIYYQEMKERNAKRREDYVKKHDTDGDGQLSRDEQQDAYKQQRAESQARYDKWKQDNPEAWAQQQKRQQEYKLRQQEQIRKYDANGDGKLTGDEWQGVREEQMEAWKKRDPDGYARHQKRQQDYIDRHDQDGDGKLSADERKVAQKAQYDKWKAKNPAAAKRHEEQRKQWEQRRKDGGGANGGQGGGAYKIAPFQGGGGGASGSSLR